MASPTQVWAHALSILHKRHAVASWPKVKPAGAGISLSSDVSFPKGLPKAENTKSGRVTATAHCECPKAGRDNTFADTLHELFKDDDGDKGTKKEETSVNLSAAPAEEAN